MNKTKWPEALSTIERVDIAQERLGKIAETLSSLIHLHENNRIIVYSKQLSAQIPRSLAFHAFHLFQHTMIRGEALKLCTLWDPPKEDRNSLPTVAKLIDDADVLAEIAARAEAKGKAARCLTA